MITLGAAPEELHVILNDGYAFATSIIRFTKKKTPEAWTTAPILKFSDGTTWTSVVSVNTAAFAATALQVAHVLSLDDTSVVLLVGDIVWAAGSVRRS